MVMEIDNAKEEVKEVVSACFRCGLCKSYCPVLRVLREEQFSPRGKVIILDNSYYERLVYDCTLCKACEVKCPAHLKLCDAFIKARKVIVASGREVPEAAEVIRNLNKTGNVYGIKEEENK